MKPPAELREAARLEAAGLELSSAGHGRQPAHYSEREFAVEVAPGLPLRFVHITASHYTDGCTTALRDALLAVPNRAGDLQRWADMFEVNRRDRVIVPYDFHMADTFVTNAMFAAFVRAAGYNTTVARHATGWVVDNQARWRQGGSNDWQRQVHPLSEPDHPVVQVSWFDAMQFAAWLSRRTGRCLRVPTKEEWLLAARPEELGDECCLFPWGNALNEPDRRMNFGTRELTGYTWIHEQFADGHAYTSPVRAFPPNARGLHDMTGNVWGWNWTNFAQDEARGSGERIARPRPLAELGVAENAALTMQGGCYLARLTHANLLAKMCHPALDGAEDIGFRLVAVRPGEAGF